MSDVIVVHGHPGAGKSTQCEAFKGSHSDRSVEHFSAGILLRGIRTGLVVSSHSDAVNNPDAPAPLPNWLVNSIIVEQVSACPPSALAIVDGYPRFADAVELFADTLKEGEHRFLGTVVLGITLSVCRSRLNERGVRLGEKRHAADIAAERHDEFETLTRPALVALSEHGPVIEFSAAASREAVSDTFEWAVNSLIRRARQKDV